MEVIVDYIKVIILGIIEGVTEFLPVSSTGHLIIAEEFISLEPEAFSNAFMVIIQLGAILAVVAENHKKLNPFSFSEPNSEKLEENKRIKNSDSVKILGLKAERATIDLWSKIIVGVIPAAILGFLLDDIIDEYLFNPIVVACMLIFYGVIIILIEKGNKPRQEKMNSFSEMSYLTALKIGFFQCLAMVPGTSRSAATIIGGLTLGCSRVLATEFSFYLAIPTMIGATLLKVLGGLGSFTGHQWILIILGSVVSFIVAYFVIKKFVAYVKSNDFAIFGYYRIVLGIIVLVVMNIL